MAQNMTDYVATRRGFRLEVPRVFNAARDIVDARAAAEPGKTAVVAVDPSGERARRVSFADLAHASDRAANFLAAHGVRKGDRVFVMLPRVPAWHEVLLGCVKLGAIPMPGTTLLTSKDIEYRVSKAEASVAVTDADGLPRVAEASERCSSLTSLITIGEDVPDGWLGWRAGLDLAADEPPDVEPTLADDPLLIYFTSGTTGYPEDGAPHAGFVRDRPRDHGAVLAGPRSRRPALDRLRHGLGEGRVGQALRAVDGWAPPSSCGTCAASRTSSGCSG